MATSGHLVNGADGPVTTSGGSSCPCYPSEQPPGEATSVPQAWAPEAHLSPLTPSLGPGKGPGTSGSGCASSLTLCYCCFYFY